MKDSAALNLAVHRVELETKRNEVINPHGPINWYFLPISPHFIPSINHHIFILFSFDLQLIFSFLFRKMSIDGNIGPFNGVARFAWGGIESYSNIHISILYNR